MPSPLRQPFIPGGELVARKPFICMGEQYNTGDDFPFGEIGLTDRKLRSMYNAGFVMAKPAKVKEETAEEDKPKRKKRR